VLEEIEEDSKEFQLKIILICDGEEALKKVLTHAIASDRIKISQNLEGRGVGGSINSGLKILDPRSWFCIFSDDDYWLSGRTESTYRKIDQAGGPRVFIGDSMGTKSLTGNFFKNRSKGQLPINPLEHCYGNKVYFKNPYYITLTSMVAPYEASKYKFDDSIKLREDIKWLIELHKAGFEILKVPEVWSKVKKNYHNTILREDTISQKEWAEFIGYASTEIKTNFALFLCRSLLVTNTTI
jgi:hypothetical protein